MGRNKFFRVAVVLVVTVVLAFPAGALAAGPPSRMQQFLRGTQDAASVAAVATALTPGGQLAALVFTGITLGAMGLEIGFYSDNPGVDTVAALVSLLVRHRNPIVEDLAQRVTQEGVRAIANEVQRQRSVGTNTGRNANTAAPRNVCYPPGAGPVAQSLTMPGNASLGSTGTGGNPGGSPWYNP